MLHKTQQGIDYFQFETFPQNGIQHAVFGRNGGASSSHLNSLNLSSAVNDDLANVVENRVRAYGLFDRSVETLVACHLKHGNNVARVSKTDQGSVIPDCDGLVTDDPSCGLTMNFADCGSVFLYDPAKRAIGLGHAGWRGAIHNLAGAMVVKMQTEFGSNTTDIVAGLGPCISVSNYEVDEPVISEVHRVFPKWVDRLLSYRVDESGQKIGRPYFNLALANHINLYEAGVKEVEFPNYCTASRTDLFFSHRAEQGKTGRFGSIFTLN